MTSKTRAELHEDLTGQSVTDGWDVLVSYSSKQLNELLQHQWNRPGSSSKVEFDTPTGSKKHPSIIHFKLELNAPEFQFKTGDVRGASLRIPLKGQYCYSDDPDEIIELKEGAYTLLIDVGITGVKGDENCDHEREPGVGLNSFSQKLISFF